MAYEKRIYTDTEEIVTYQDMNRIEQGIYDNQQGIDAALVNAKEYADAEAAKRVLKTDYDIKITELEAKNTSQDTAIGKRVLQTDYDTKMALLETKNTEQDTAIANKVNNSTFTSAKTALETKDMDLEDALMLKVSNDDYDADKLLLDNTINALKSADTNLQSDINTRVQKTAYASDKAALENAIAAKTTTSLNGAATNVNFIAEDDTVKSMEITQGDKKSILVVDKTSDLKNEFITGETKPKNMTNLDWLTELPNSTGYDQTVYSIHDEKVEYIAPPTKILWFDKLRKAVKYNDGDRLVFYMTFCVKSFATTSALSRLTYIFNRYDGSNVSFGIDFKSNGTFSLFKGTISSDATVELVEGELAVGKQFTIKTVINSTQNLETKGLYVSSLTNSTTFTDFKMDIVDFHCGDTQQVVVKSADTSRVAETAETSETSKVADALKGFDIKTTKIIPIKNMEDFHKLGFGMFIHWGVYSALKGKFSGTNVTGEIVNIDAVNLPTGGEWIFRTARIPKATYKTYQTQFTAENWDAENVAKMAYRAGMKYVVLTLKHHEGFCLFESENSEWDITESGARTTVVNELKMACEKYGLKFCVYFSQYYDWNSEGGWGQEFLSIDNTTDPYTTQQHEQYVYKTKKLINEIIDKFNPYILWYDIKNSEGLMSVLKENELEYYPNVIVNDRLHNSYTGDFGTGEGNYYRGTNKYAENCYTLDGSWGYCESNSTVEKTITLEDLLKIKVLESISRNQNCLLNIAPKADGSIPELQSNVLLQMSSFIKKYGKFTDSIAVNKRCQPFWGRMIAHNNVLKCYVYTGSSIRIDGIDTTFIKSVRVYNATDEYSSSNYSISDDGNSLIVNNIVYDNISKLAMVDVEFNENIVSNDINYVSRNERITAFAFNIINSGGAFLCFEGGVYCIGGWRNNSEFLETVFKFKDVSNSYNVNFDVQGFDSSVALTLTMVLENIETKQKQETTIAITKSGITTGGTTIALAKNATYKLTVKKTGAWVNLKSVFFS